MKWISTFLILFIGILQTTAQDITGVWSGTFEQENYDPMFGKFFNETYKYEVQINNLSTNALEGVTYSYLSTRFYGKASLNGMYQPKLKSLVIKEIKLVEMKSDGPSDGCLMTCYLEYKKEGNIETLTGTYTSKNMRTKKDCGTGIVTLKKVPESKFVKEDFLLKKEKKLLPAKPPVANTTPKPNSNNIVRSLPKNNPNFAEFPPTKNTPKPAPMQEVTKPKIQTPPIPKENSSPKEVVITPKKNVEQPVATVETKPKNIQIPNTPAITPSVPKSIITDKPKILEERKNKLANTIVVDASEVTLEFYDNGEIDGDVITVYKENELVINKKMLSSQPVILKLHFTELGEQFNIYTVAETLGEIPPNTALMIVNYGGKRQEILLTSDSKTNALTVIEYNKANRKY